MKKLGSIILVILIAVQFTACLNKNHKRRVTGAYPSLQWESLKLISVINTIDQHFTPGIYRHIVMRPFVVPTGQTVNKSSAYRFIPLNFNQIFTRIDRTHHTIYHANGIEVTGPNIDQTIAVSCCNNMVGLDTGTPLQYSPYLYWNTPNPTGVPYSLKAGGSIYVEGIFFPASVGFGDSETKTAPLSLAYYPSGEFMGFVPGYTVTHGGFNHILRLIKKVNNQTQTIDDLNQRLKFHGRIDHNDVFGTINGFIEHGQYRYGTFKISNIFSPESGLTYEIFSVPMELP